MAKREHKVRCIVCPIGCVADVTTIDGAVTAVTRLACERGKAYAREEVVAPKRMLTTTVRIKGGALPLLPVVSKGALPKDKIIACARYLTGVEVEAPVTIDEVVCSNILGLGIDIVASRSLGRVKAEG